MSVSQTSLVAGSVALRDPVRLLVTVLWTLRLTRGGEMEGSLSSSGAAKRCRLEEDIVQTCRGRSREWLWPALLRWFQPTTLTRSKHFRLVGEYISGQGALQLQGQGRSI